MNKAIVINKSIKFEPEKKCLSTNNATVTLNTPASYCLELLLENQGHLVTHEQLYQFAWGRFGMEATANTLYQNISVLRKSLQECGLTENIIRTMARRGFILSTSVEVIAHQEDETKEEKTALSLQHPQPDNESIGKTPMLTVNQQVNSSKGKTLWSKLVIISSGTMVLTLFVFGLYLLFGHAFGPFHYTFFTNKGNCYYYVNSTSKNDGKLNGIINSLHQQCTGKRYLYLTRYTEDDVMSVLYCRKPFSHFKKNSCISYYYAR